MQNKIMDYIEHPIIKIEIGTDLIPVYWNKNENEISFEFNQKIIRLRKEILFKFGFETPTIYIRPEQNIPKNQAIISIRNSQVSKLIIDEGKIYVMKATKLLENKSNSNILSINKGKEPEKCEMLHEHIIDKNIPTTARADDRTLSPIETLISVIRKDVIENMPQMLTRQQVRDYLDATKRHNAEVVNEIEAYSIPLNIIQGVFKNLLKEKISIAEIGYILEYISDEYMEIFQEHSRDEIIDRITEYVKTRLVNEISSIC